MIRRLALALLSLLVPSLVQATCTITDTYSQVICSDSPVHYYRMDNAGSATTESDKVGAIDGTYTASGATSTTTALACCTDAAAAFDGSAGDLHTSSATSGVFQPSATNNQGFTVELWWKPAATASKVFICSGGAGNPNEAWDIETSGGGAINAYIIDNGCTTSVYLGATSLGTYSTGNWYYLVLTTVGNGTGLTHAIGYQNAVLKQTNTTTTGSGPCNTSKPMTIAHYNAAFANGSGDEVAFYTTELSQSRITAHFNAGNALPVHEGWPWTVKRPELPKFRNDDYWTRFVRDGYNTGLFSKRFFNIGYPGFEVVPNGNGH